MNRNLYGKKMFVADLLLVSVWALMAWHSCIERFIVPAMILMRLAVSFELYRKSRWAFCGAMMFAVAYVGCVFDLPSEELAFEPIKRIVYALVCLVGDTEKVVSAFQEYHSDELKAILWPAWGLYSIWLVVMPLVCSFRLGRVFAICRQRPKFLCYYAAVLALTCCVFYVDKDYFLIFFAALMSLSPLAYRLIYRKGRISLIQELLSDKVLKAYLGLVLIFAATALTGLYNVGPAKFFLAIFAPVMLYVIASRVRDAKGIKTLTAFFYAISEVSILP